LTLRKRKTGYASIRVRAQVASTACIVLGIAAGCAPPQSPPLPNNPDSDVAGTVDYGDEPTSIDPVDEGNTSGDGGQAGLSPVMFTLSVSGTSRPVTITGTAVPAPGTNLPEGRYTWRLNGLEYSGPLSTHRQRSCALDVGGRYVVSLTVLPEDGSATILCPEQATGLTEAVLIVLPRISGRVRDAQGHGIPGIPVVANGCGATTTADSSGDYILEVPYAWSGSVVPRLDQHTCDVPSRAYSNLTTDVIGQDYVVTGGQVRIGGFLRDALGTPLADTLVVADNGGGSTRPDSNGHYEFRVPFHWSGTIGPDQTIYAFAPPVRSYWSVLVDAANQDFTAGSFTLADAATLLQSIPSYAGGPRILLLRNTDFGAQGEQIMRELARVCGTIMFNVNGWASVTSESPGVRLAIELADSGVPVWFELGDISGQGAYASISALDPNYLHVTPAPHESYFNPVNQGETTPSLWLFCPGRHAARRQIARFFALGLRLREAGLSAQRVTGVWIHDESAYVAGRCGEYYVYNTLYSNCSACGSIAEHNRLLAELRADIVHALLRGLGAEPVGDLNRNGVEDVQDEAVYQQAVLSNDPIGDFNNDGQVNAADLAAWHSIAPGTPKAITRFWWSGGYGWGGDGRGYVPSPWLPIESYPGTPIQNYANFANYDTDPNAVARLAGTIDYNLTHTGLPVAPFFSLTYDGTARREYGVDPELNRAKAQVAASRGCPLICCYALNPARASWMTPELFRNQFESIKAIVEGSRSPTP